MGNFEELYKSDKYRYGGKIRIYEKLFHFFFRKCQTCKSKFQIMYKIPFYLITRLHGIEISGNVKCGKGLYVGHPYNITINAKSVIGENCNIHKGVTIGQENRGKRKGVPKIGNKVWIGINATIVGNITIGDDVLIAPNCYVNCDIPSHSIVLGNPCQIIRNDNATECYIERTI